MASNRRRVKDSPNSLSAGHTKIVHSLRLCARIATPLLLGVACVQRSGSHTPGWMSGPELFSRSGGADVEVACFSVDPVRPTAPVVLLPSPDALAAGTDFHAVTRCHLSIDCSRPPHEWVRATALISFPCLTSEARSSRKEYLERVRGLADHEWQHVMTCGQTAGELNALARCDDALKAGPAALEENDRRGREFDRVTGHGPPQ